MTGVSISIESRFVLGGILPCSRERNGKREETRRFLENVLEFQRCFETLLRMLARRFSNTERANRKVGGEGREGRSALQSCAM